MIFSIATGPSVKEAHETLKRSKGKVDGVEIRLDTFDGLDLHLLQGLLREIRHMGMKSFLTLRAQRQGGHFQGGEEERLDWIEKIASLSPDWIDLEYDVPRSYCQKLIHAFPEVGFLLSYHNFEETPDNLGSLLEQMQCPGISAYKIATTARSSVDALRVLQLLQTPRSYNLTAIAMGEFGLPTRVLGPVFGNFIDYAPLDKNKEMAPGQIDVETLTHFYRYPHLNSQTKLFAVLCGPTSHPLSHLIYNTVFDALEVNALYIKISAEEKELPSLFSYIRQLPFHGLSVTMPLKESVISQLDALTPTAQAIGAVNTICREGDRLIGDNTDASGALDALEKHTPVKGKKMVILGAGGAAKAIAYEALQRGTQVILINRTASKAQTLAHTLGCEGGGTDLFPLTYDILVNATPQGDFLNPSWILPGAYVMDIVTRPPETPLLALAKEKKCPCVFGYEMFIQQGIRQYCIWFPATDKKGRIEKTIADAVFATLQL